SLNPGTKLAPPFRSKEKMSVAASADLSGARALQIDERLAEAYASMGFINDSSWQWAEAESEYKRALELNTYYATAHQWYYLHLLMVGRTEEAMAEIKRAQELDPLSVIINTLHTRKMVASSIHRLIKQRPRHWHRINR